MELRGGGRRQGEGQVETCRDDGFGAVKDGHKVWTNEPGGRTTTETNFRDVATVHSVAGVFFARCCKSCDLPQRALLINRDGHFCPLR